MVEEFLSQHAVDDRWREPRPLAAKRLVLSRGRFHIIRGLLAQNKKKKCAEAGAYVCARARAAIGAYAVPRFAGCRTLGVTFVTSMIVSTDSREGDKRRNGDLDRGLPPSASLSQRLFVETHNSSDPKLTPYRAGRSFSVWHVSNGSQPRKQYAKELPRASIGDDVW